MLEVRIHGRGGQGVVTAAELLSVSAFLDGHEAQAFPSFGSERMGAPVMAFCRISDAPIRLREPVTKPDAVIIVDATLLHHVDLFAGLSPEGYVLINSSRSLAELGVSDVVDRQPPGHVTAIDATEIARGHLGRPLPNVCLLGAFAALTRAVSPSSIDTAVRERFMGKVAEANIRAAREAFATTQQMTHA
jgi:pyruvate ferredoxin oxidoreductase gamma subunit